MNKPLNIVIHCTDVSYKKVRDQLYSVNNEHEKRNFPISSRGLYVGYHYLYTGGKEYICRDIVEEGAHCNQLKNGVSMNFQSIGLCIGFDGDIEMPPKVEYDLLKKRIIELQDMYDIPNANVYFHREFALSKTCPGSLITDSWKTELLRRSYEGCIAENNIIEEQKEKISLLEHIINKLVTLIK